MSRQHLHRACKKGAPKLEKRVDLSETINSSFDEVDENIAPMSQFDQIVGNIAWESREEGYNPKEDTNWDDLDWELQIECWKRMDMKTKIRLGQTCKLEKFTFDEKIRTFEYVAENIALESKKCNYNPKKDPNWCNLPAQLRYECLQRMDFQTRFRFRRVSKLEKLLVESTKHHLEFLRLYCSDKYDEWDVETDFLEDLSDTVPLRGCIPAIFRFSEFDLLRFDIDYDCGESVLPMLEELVKFAPFHFKRLAVFDNPSIAFIMRHCVNLEKVDFRGNLSKYPLKQILEIPIAMKVKEFRFSRPHTTQFSDFFYGLVRKWIANDVEVGKSIQFELDSVGVVNKVANTFSCRLIEKTDKIVRIRMNNDKTQILLRLIGFRDIDLSHCFCRTERHIFEYCSCKVIPIDMPESEYATGDGWIQAVYEKRLKEDGKLENPVEFNAEDRKVWRRL